MRILNKNLFASLARHRVRQTLHSKDIYCSFSTVVPKEEDVERTEDGKEIVRIVAEPALRGVLYSNLIEEWKTDTPIKNYEERGKLSSTSEEELNRKIRIYQRARNPSQHGLDHVTDYQVASDRGPSWQDPLTGWCVKRDSFMQDTGLQNQRFSSIEEAKELLMRRGYKNIVVEKSNTIRFPRQRYADNFLNKHVSNRLGKMDKKEFQKKQFKQQGKLKPCWVNLKHTSFGPSESTKVSKTQWSNPHPNNHTAGEWAGLSFEQLQDRSRSHGKN